MTTTTETKTIQITMSERRPLKINPEHWPIIARADRHDGKIEFQANRVWRIIVRQHADGRRLVYGWLGRGNGGMPIDWRGAAGGFVVEPARRISTEPSFPNDDATIRAIRRIGGIIEDEQLAADCIADLPAEELT